MGWMGWDGMDGMGWDGDGDGDGMGMGMDWTDSDYIARLRDEAALERLLDTVRGYYALIGASSSRGGHCFFEQSVDISLMMHGGSDSPMTLPKQKANPLGFLQTRPLVMRTGLIT